MAVDDQALLQAALHLPADARARLVDELLISLHEQQDDAWLTAWQEESARRWEQLEAGQVKTVSGDEAIATLRERLKNGKPHA
jgi:putative addiction module component (TIGR02574 family)